MGWVSEYGAHGFLWCSLFFGQFVKLGELECWKNGAKNSDPWFLSILLVDFNSLVTLSQYFYHFLYHLTPKELSWKWTLIRLLILYGSWINSSESCLGLKARTFRIELGSAPLGTTWSKAQTWMRHDFDTQTQAQLLLTSEVSTNLIILKDNWDNHPKREG